LSFKPRTPPGPPATRRERIVDTLHGIGVADPYRWLEDAGSAKVQSWMTRQDRWTRRALASLAHRPALVERLRELYYYDAISPPLRRGGRLFYTRRHSDREKAVVYWRDEDGGEERVLFDPNTMSEDGSVSLGVWAPSPDGRVVAYALRENAADESTLYVREVETGLDRADVIPGAKYADPSWMPDGSGFYYTWLPTDPSIDPADRPGYAEVRFHPIGPNEVYDAGDDPIVHPSTGSAETFVGGAVSRDGQFLIITVMHGWRSTDIYFRDLAGDSSVLHTLVEGRDSNYWVAAWQGRLYILTDEGAPRYRVFRADAKAPARERWREIVPEGDATIESMQILGGRMVLGYLLNASSAVEVRTLGGVHVRDIELPGIGTVDLVVGTEEDDDAYFTYSSFIEPPRVYRTSIRDGSVEEWARVELPIDTRDFTVEQVWYESGDGTPISMFLIRRKDLVCDASNRTILYGYGGFNVKLTPTFAPALVPWLERGGMYAIPNIRGGGEYGEDWHRAGMLLEKQTAFDDFTAAAEFLIREGYTAPEQLAIRGGSNGGLLVGAAMTQRPDLFRAVVCAVPLLDMVRYHLFGSGRTWVPEYGSADDEAQFRALYGYSPYHRVAPGVRYPALLVLSADSDDRVDPLHARKFTAAVQHAVTGETPVLLRIERQAGHGGADKIAQDLEAQADTYAFLCEQLKVPPHP
jgi:prolyl oligopeptidase